MSLKWQLLFALSVSALAGCGWFGSNGPTEVARGEYYSAGKPEYDSFFIVLHEKQVELLAAPNDPRDARSELTRAVGLTPEASDDALRERLAQEARKLAGQGLRLRLDSPEPSEALDASATLYTSETITSTPLRNTLPHAATRLVRSRNRMRSSKAELEKLRVMGINLESNVEQAFRTDGPWKRDEVRKNLGDGQKVITLMQSRAQEVESHSTRLLTLLVSATATDETLGKSPSVAPPAAEEPAKPRRNVGARPSAVAKPAPGRTSGASPAARRPPGKREEDREPASKPTQGSAPAEIEP